MEALVSLIFIILYKSSALFGVKFKGECKSWRRCWCKSLWTNWLRINNLRELKKSHNSSLDIQEVIPWLQDAEESGPERPQRLDRRREARGKTPHRGTAAGLPDARRWSRPKKVRIRSQSYKTLISSFFRFLLLSLSVCSRRKYCLFFKVAKLNSKKQKKSSFYEEKSLVGLTPAGQ